MKEEARETGSSSVEEQDVDVKSLAAEDVVKVKAHFSGACLSRISFILDSGMVVDGESRLL